MSRFRKFEGYSRYHRHPRRESVRKTVLRRNERLAKKANHEAQKDKQRDDSRPPSRGKAQ